MAIDMRALRESRGLTMEELALKSGVSVRTIWRAEQTNGNPQIKTVEKLLLALGLDLTTRRIK